MSTPPPGITTPGPNPDPNTGPNAGPGPGPNSGPGAGLGTITRRTFGAGAVATALGLSLSACGGSASDEPVTAATGPAVRGGEATIIMSLEANGLDPATVNTTGVTYGTRLAAIFDVLVRADQQTGEVRPHLAESLTSLDGGRTWTLRLRDGVLFSDGTPLDAEAVRFNWARLADPALRSPQLRVVKDLNLVVTDPRTLTVTLPSPDPHFDQAVARGLSFIGSPTAIKSDPRGFAAKPVGAGPFVLTQWLRGDRMQLERNPRYWQPELPYLDRLVIRTIGDEQQQINTLSAGQADVVPSSSLPLTEKGRKARQPAVTTMTSGGFVVVFNTRRGPFDDVRARQAVAAAVDPSELVKVAYGADIKGATSLFPDGVPYADPSARQPAPDPARAQRLLDELAADGKRLSFTFTTLASPVSRMIAEFVQSRLRTLKNVDMEVKVVDGPVYQTGVIINRDFEASLFSVSFTDPEPALRDMLGTDGPSNLGGWSNPAADLAFAEARATKDRAVRTAAYAKVQKLIADEVPVWTYLAASSSAIHRKDITGITMFADACLLVDKLGRTD